MISLLPGIALFAEFYVLITTYPRVRVAFRFVEVLVRGPASRKTIIGVLVIHALVT